MIPVYYTNNLENYIVVNSIKPVPLFRRFEFIPLHKDLQKSTDKQQILLSDLGVSDEHAVLIWGNGTEHSYSYHFSPSKRRFSKIVYDAHHDLGSPGQMINCANHNSYLLNKENLEDLEILGLKLSHYEHFNKKISAITNPDRRVFVSQELSSRLEGRNVHTSIDLDVVKDFPCLEIWQKDSTSSFDMLLESFKDIMGKNNIIRLDMGGFNMNSINDKTFDVGKVAVMYSKILEAYIQKYS